MHLNRRDLCRAALAVAAAPALLDIRTSNAGQQMVAARRIATAQSSLAMRLLGAIAGTRSAANIVISPASLAGTLSTIERGGTFRLARALHRLLGFDRRASAWSDFNTLRRATNTPNGNNGPLTSANALFIDSAVAPFERAIHNLAAHGIKIDVSDFGKPESLAAINTWVNDRTKGKIPNMLDALAHDTALIAVNALHFKDHWLIRFDADETRPALFHLAGGETIDLPLMHTGSTRLRFRQDERFIAVELPYATLGYSMVIVTTRETPEPARAFTGLADWLGGTGFAEYAGEVTLPRFGVKSSMDLMPALSALGLRPPNSLPGFAKGPLRLAKAQQHVVVNVDEEGTEAAAATAVLATRSFDGGYVKAIVDKPFLFALRDSTTGLIVIAGYIGKPEAGTDPA